MVVHGMSDMFSVPDKWGEMARAYPDVPVVLYHIGVPLMVERCCELAKTLPNFYLSTSGSYVPAIKAAYDAVGPDKIIFSSDAPFGNPAQALEKVRFVVKNEAHLDKILCQNAKDILHL